MNELADHSEVVYQHNARLRRLLRGSAGPEWLRVFTRHWLFAMLLSRRPDLAARLPSSYASGHDLPPRAQPTLPPGPHRKKPPPSAKSPPPPRGWPNRPANAGSPPWAPPQH
jgi:hypothetical protein